MFLGLQDPDQLVRGTDLDPDPSIMKQKYHVKPFFFENVPLKTNKDPEPDPLVREIRIRGSGSVPKCHGSATLAQAKDFCYLTVSCPITVAFFLSIEAGLNPPKQDTTSE
jgi:hypothetical protein